MSPLLWLPLQQVPLTAHCALPTSPHQCSCRETTSSVATTHTGVQDDQKLTARFLGIIGAAGLMLAMIVHSSSQMQLWSVLACNLTTPLYFAVNQITASI